MIKCHCNIIVVSYIQLLVNENFFNLLFFGFDWTQFWHEMLKIASVSINHGQWENDTNR